MPLVRIDVPDNTPDEQRRAIADGVNAGLVRGLGMPETKKATFAAIAEELEAAGVRPDDVFVAVTENGPEDWHAGRAGSGTAA
jgi:phenylpyruvate tautomerase PptA (4-oxalocrotonate tautomerase family)